MTSVFNEVADQHVSSNTYGSRVELMILKLIV